MCLLLNDVWMNLTEKESRKHYPSTLQVTEQLQQKERNSKNTISSSLHAVSWSAGIRSAAAAAAAHVSSVLHLVWCICSRLEGRNQWSRRSSRRFSRPHVTGEEAAAAANQTEACFFRLYGVKNNVATDSVSYRRGSQTF